MTSKRWGKRISALVLLSLFLPLVSGCWDNLEVEKRSLVLGMSVDKAESEEKTDVATHIEGVDPVPGQRIYKVSVQIAIPGKIPLGPGEGGGGGGGKSDKTLWVIGVTGHSIDDAIMNLQQRMASPLFFGHLRVIVVSEAVAREGMSNLNDYFQRNAEVRRTTWILVSKGNAEDVIRAQPPLGRVPSVYLTATFENAIRMGKFPKDFAGKFWTNSSKKGQEGFLPYVRMMNKEAMEIAGLAIFKGDMMVETTKPLEIGAFMTIKHLNPGGYRVITPIDGSAVTVYTTYRASRIRVKIRDDVPEFYVNVHLELNIEEKTHDTLMISDEEILNKIEKHDSRMAKEYYLKFIQKTQRAGADIFGFGELVRAKKPGYWNKHVRTKEKWQEMYKNVPVHVQTDFKIRRVGMRAQ